MFVYGDLYFLMEAIAECLSVAMKPVTGIRVYLSAASSTVIIIFKKLYQGSFLSTDSGEL